MRKLYDEFFYVPKQGNVREKVLVARVAVSVALILLCMAIMNFTAYAYFSCNVSSGLNTIQSAKYDLDITPPTELASVADNNVNKNDWTEIYVLDNSGSTEEKNFSFTLAKSENTTAKVGYCKIEIKTDVNDANNAGDVQRFYTKPIGTYVENDIPVTNDSRTVTIAVAPNKTATVTFVAEWGTCGETPIEGETIEPTYGAANSTGGETIEPIYGAANSTEGETIEPTYGAANSTGEVNGSSTNFEGQLQQFDNKEAPDTEVENTTGSADMTTSGTTENNLPADTDVN